MSFEIFERVYSSHWFLTSYNGPGFVRDFPKIGGSEFMTKAIYIMENGMCRYVFDNIEFEKAANYTANRLINDNKWRHKSYKKIDYFTKKYFQAGEKLRKLNLSALDNKKILQIINNIVPLQHYHQVYSILVNGVILDGRNHLSNKIREELNGTLGYPENFDDYWSLLTLATKISLRQKRDYEMALLAKESKKLSKEIVGKKLRTLHDRYCWLDYNNMGPPSSFRAFKDELNTAVKNNVNLDLPRQLKRVKIKQERLMKKLGFNRRLRFLVKLSQHVIWQKGYRKDMQYHGFYCYENLFMEMARRNRTEDWQAFGYLFPWEVGKFLLKKTPKLREMKVFMFYCYKEKTRFENWQGCAQVCKESEISRGFLSFKRNKRAMCLCWKGKRICKNSSSSC